MTERPALVVHGHFYQPPRENPWTEAIDREHGADPYHDWNERIYHECYRPNAFARILDESTRVLSIVNNYSSMSFNIGPTLLSWLARSHPKVYQRILDADKDSARLHGGHGNALAQGYNHAILPLCNERDRRTQVRWGVCDFRHRFGRDPEGIWLPETAANDATLATLIDERLKFVILSPHQAQRVRSPNGEWRDVSNGSIDPTRPYGWLHTDGSGRSIALFFYDDAAARAIAFGGALASSSVLVERFLHAARGPGHIAHVATDGESYGHHFRLGERCLAYALHTEAAARGFWVTNYGEFLERHPPVDNVELKPGPNGEGTAWSCSHGLGRWTRDCGCSTGGDPDWNQAWRGPLRAAFDFLRDEVTAIYEEAGSDLLRDPWVARDDYIEVLSGGLPSRAPFLERHAARPFDDDDRVRTLTLLEMQRHALLMYTSCGWFFTELSGIETSQVIRYAARVIDLIDDLGFAAPTEAFLDRLAEAKSNLPKMGTGADVFRRVIETSRVGPDRVAAHITLSSLVADGHEAGVVGEYSYRRSGVRQERHGRLTLATSRVALDSVRTGARVEYAAAAIHLGGLDFYCTLTPFQGLGRFKAVVDRIWAQFRTASLPALLRVTDQELGHNEYGLADVLPEGRQQMLETVFADVLEHFVEQYARLHDDYRRILDMLQEAGFEVPHELRAAAEITLGKRLDREIHRLAKSRDPAAFRNAIDVAHEAAQHGYRIDQSSTRHIFEELLEDLVLGVLEEPSPERVAETLAMFDVANSLGINPYMNRIEELVYFAIIEQRLGAEGPARELLKRLGLSRHLLIQPPDQGGAT